MERIAIISDIHANMTAFEAVLKDIENRNIERIFCLGDSIGKGVSPDKVIDILREKAELILLGNADYFLCRPNENNRTFWTKSKLGKERAKFICNLPKMHEFYLSGQLVRLFHATPYALDGMYNPMFSNIDSRQLIISNPEDMFENTEFLGKTSNDNKPDIIGYGHIHTPFIVKFKNKTIFNVGSVGEPIEMLNLDENDESNKFSTVATYTILEGNYNSQTQDTIAFTQVRVKYDVNKEIELIKKSDYPNKDVIIKILKTSISEKNLLKE